MAVITISRLVGRKGTLIGKEVAKRMNYNYTDKELVQEIMHQYGETEFKKFYNTGLDIWERYFDTTKIMQDFYKRIVLSIAKSGNVVIVGRGSFASLVEYIDVLDVLVYAPKDVRINAIMEMRGIPDPKKAEKYIIHKERIRQSFIEQMYNIKWDQIDNFDLVFNTGKLNPELVIDAIVMAGKAVETKIADTSELITSDIESDEILDNAVKRLLKK